MINISMKQLRGRAAKVAHPEDGFTITELLVATAVFSGVLLLTIVGFIQISHLFYKGVTVSQTRKTASQIMDAITSDIRLSNGVSNISFYTTRPNGSPAGFPAFCIGDHLYVWNTDSFPINLAKHDFSYNFGLIQSQTNGPCPASASPASIKSQNPVELLGDDMRVSNLQITSQPNTSSYQITLVVTFGEDAVLDLSNPSLPTCKGIATGSQFCSVIQLNSTASIRPSLL